MIVGGIALLLLGGSHITFDADLAFARDKDNLDHIVDALGPFHPRLRGIDPHLPFIWDAQTVRNSTILTLVTDIGDVDLLGETEGVSSFSELYSRSVEIDLDGERVHVACLEDLLAMKLAANRDKDQRHIFELRALISVQSEGHSQGS